jgi:16S rRNA (uracil1498-N3)-methyltransferase
MRIPRLFVSTPLTSGVEIALDPEQAHYVSRVLRLRAGSELVLFDGGGGEYRARLTSLTARAACVSVGDFIARDIESPVRVCLAQGISRGERMDYTVQKAVELGASEILPLLTERCGVHLDPSRAEKRVDHWQKVAASACAQCGRNKVPHIAAVHELGAWLARPSAELRLVLDPRASRGLATLPRSAAVTLLIGPEGGLSAAELAAVSHAGFQSVHMGPRTLRTETAAVTALAAIQTLWGDLGSDRPAAAGPS